MEVIFKRLMHSQGQDWRHGYKALCLLECLLQQASEAMIADTLNVSALLYNLMGYRANEKKDAVMLRALNVMSIYDGGNRGRGEKIRTQALFTYKIANDCHFMRSIRQRFTKLRYKSRLQSHSGIMRCDSIRVYTLKNGNYNDPFETEAMYLGTSSMADKIKFGVKFGVNAVKYKVNHLKSKNMKREAKKRIIIRAPSFKSIHNYFTTEMSHTYASSLPVFLPKVKNEDSEGSYATLIDINEANQDTDDLLNFASLDFLESSVMAQKAATPAQSWRSNVTPTVHGSTKNPFTDAFDENTIADAFGDGDSI